MLRFISEFKPSSMVKLARGFASTVEPIKLVLYTKEDCSLCDTAKEQIEDQYPGQFVIEEVDITKNNRELFRKYKLDIPVFHFNGEFLMQHRVDTEALDKLVIQRATQKDKIRSDWYFT